METLVLIPVCILLGYLLKRTKRIPETAPATLNAYIIHIALPAVAILNLRELRLTRELLFPVMMPWLVLGMSWVLFLVLGKAMSWNRKTVGALILTAGLGNTSFVGFPLLEALYGSSSLSIGILADQPGTFLALSSFGIAIAAFFSMMRPSPKGILSRLIGFPPFLAMVLALTVFRYVELPGFAIELLKRLSQTLIPVALFSVGAQMRLRLELLRTYRTRLFLGLIYKLVLAPGVITLVYLFLGASGSILHVSIAEAAMAPMITGAVIAADHDLEPELCSLMIAVGIPLSLLTVPLWSYLTRGL